MHRLPTRESGAFSVLGWLQAAWMFAVAMRVLCARLFSLDDDRFVVEDNSRR